MRYARSRWLATAAALAMTAALATAVPAAGAAAATKLAAPAVRVNQVGYTPKSSKVAFAMLPRPVGSVRFAVIGSHGVVYRGRSTDDVGRWNKNYHAVYQLNFSGLCHLGSYRIELLGSARAQSPSFRIASSAALYHQLVLNAVRYYTSERDGGDVVSSVLDRKPANLTDRRAYVYKDPRYDDNDNLLGKLTKIAGPVNVSGGWFDAGGGYEKFGYTASYTDGLMLIAARDFPGEYRTLQPEADFGLSWLQKLWNPAKKVLYIQVGIGNGNASNTIQGDYNFWFLPQAEDHMDVKPGGNPGPTAYFVKYRPVFEAAAPGKPIDPDFAGRFAADFALGAQLSARTSRASAEHLLSLARGIYAMAKTTDVGQLVTTFPNDYYPGTEWKSDMLWGAAEIALADEALHVPAWQLHNDLQVAAYWANQYIAQGHPVGGDTLNLYDVSGLAHFELYRALEMAGNPDDLAVSKSSVRKQFLRQVGDAISQAGTDPWGFGNQWSSGDTTSHGAGLAVMASEAYYLTGSRSYDTYSQRWLANILGTNAWGSSFIVGDGSTFPNCIQHQVANLAGALDGTSGGTPVLWGAASEGPASAATSGVVDGMILCPANGVDTFQKFNGNDGAFDASQRAVYRDNMQSYSTTEPAIDLTSTSFLMWSWRLAQRPTF